MKTRYLFCAFLSLFFLAVAQAAPVNARYVKFEGYYTSNTSTSTHIGIHEIEVYSGGLNAAKNSTVTAISVAGGNNVSWLKDGITTGTALYTSRTISGIASEAAPHWIQMDLGSSMPVDRIKIYFASSFQNTFSISLSSDGTTWTQVGRYDLATGTIEKDPTAPWVTIVSAAMRPGTMFMDVVYRVGDVDDATVKVRALAFIDGMRSFTNVIRPSTFVGGTADKIGDAIVTNADHTLTWDVAADWQIDLGQLKFEVLAIDSRGLLTFDWLKIPAAGGNPEVEISKNTPNATELLDALYWQYADGDTGLTLTNGVLKGNANSGDFNGLVLASGTTAQPYGTPYIFKRMNLDVDDGVLANAARAELENPQGVHAVKSPYSAMNLVLVGWGDNSKGQITIPGGLNNVIQIDACGNYSVALKSDGTVVAWGDNYFNQTIVPEGLSGVTAIAAGGQHVLALRSDGTVVGWGGNSYGQATSPPSLNGVKAIASGDLFSIALKNDGTVVAWGENNYGQTNVPAGLSGVVAISAASNHAMALKGNGTVVAWGRNLNDKLTIPSSLNNATAIEAGSDQNMALRGNSAVSWGYSGEYVPTQLNGVNVFTLSLGGRHGLAIKMDNAVVAWGENTNGQQNIPPGLGGVIQVAAGGNHSLALRVFRP